MLLKNACFRLDGAAAADPVAPFMGPSRRWMAAYYPAVEHESYHNVWFWALLLRHKRRHIGRALAFAMDDSLLRNARTIYRNWWISQRYRSEVPTPDEVAAVYNAVTWLLENHTSLRR